MTAARQLRSTRTFVLLGLSKAAYDEIATKLQAAGYDHAFVDGVIDMHGLAVECEPPGKILEVPDPRAHPLGKQWANAGPRPKNLPPS
jgi:hypothetical protein